METAADKNVGINDIKRNYPDEWILLGNPEINEQKQAILAGIVLYHSPDKREVCYLGKPLIKDYKKIALFFNRVTPRETKNVLSSIFSPAKL